MAGEWRDCTLGDVLTLQRGFDLPVQDRLLGTYPIIASTGEVGSHNEAMVKAPGVVIGRSGSLGGGQYITRDFWPLNTTLWVKDFKKNDARFCYYLLKSIDLSKFNVGGAVPTLNRNHVHPHPVRVPSAVDEQRAIAHILGTLDDKIDLNRRMNETLEALARAMFKSWFVSFDPVRAKMSGELPESICQRLGLTSDLLALFPDRFVDSELGKIPEGWEVRKIEKILTRLSTKTRYIKDEVAPYGAVPVFEQGADILLGYHNGTAQFPASANDPAFIFGDHTCVTHLACEPFDISQNVIPLKGADRPTLWVYYAIRDKQVFQEYRRHWMELVAKNAVVPTEPICKEFAKIVSPLHLGMETNVRQGCELAVIRDTLLPKLLSGELRVPVTGAA
jgi:type I restriction enzyme S subunit